MADQSNMNPNTNQQQNKPSLVAGHAEYIKGMAEVRSSIKPWRIYH